MIRRPAFPSVPRRAPAVAGQDPSELRAVPRHHGPTDNEGREDHQPNGKPPNQPEDAEKKTHNVSLRAVSSCRAIFAPANTFGMPTATANASHASSRRR